LKTKHRLNIVAIGIITVLITGVSIAGFAALLLQRASDIRMRYYIQAEYRAACCTNYEQIEYAASLNEDNLLTDAGHMLPFTVILLLVSMLMSGIIIISVLMFITRPMLIVTQKLRNISETNKLWPDDLP